MSEKYLTGYECPGCEEDPSDEPYQANDKQYPIISAYGNDGSMQVASGGHSWTETHFCEECEIEFEFDNADY